MGNPSDIYKCPDKLVGKNPFKEDIMAIYWTQYTGGNVRAMAYDAALYNDGKIRESINKKYIKKIENGLIDAFSSLAREYFDDKTGKNVIMRTIQPITRAYAFTWDDMINGQPGQTVMM